VSGRVGEHDGAPRILAESASPDRDDLPGTYVDVVDHHVDMDLLRDRVVRPGRRPVAACTLEAEAGRVIIGSHNDEIIA
jgi:hypothetical protein